MDIFERDDFKGEKMKTQDTTYCFSDEDVCQKSKIALEIIRKRKSLNKIVDKANNNLVKRFYNIDHNTYREGILSAKHKELMGLVASLSLRCDDCIYYHIIQAYKYGASCQEQEETLNIALVVGGSITIPHLRRAYALLEELYTS